MSEIIVTKEQGVESVSAVYEVTDTPKKFVFAGSSGATAQVFLNGALVATLRKGETYDASATGEYTIIVSPNCGTGTVTAEDIISGAAAAAPEAQFADKLCLSDGTTATKYYDVTEDGEVVFGYILADGSFVESLDGLSTTSESEFDYYEQEYGFTLDSGVTRAISLFGTEIIAAGQSGAITVDDEAVATVAASLRETYPTLCNITVTASIGTVDDDEHSAFTGLRVFVRVCKNAEPPYFPINPNAIALTSTNGETQTSYYVGFTTGSPCDCVSDIEVVDCPEIPGDSCDTPLYTNLCNPTDISNPVVEAIEQYAVVSSTEIHVYDISGNPILITATYNAGTNTTTYHDAAGNVLTLGTDFVTFQVATPDGSDIADNTTITLSDITGVDPIKTFTVIRDLEDALDTDAGNVTVTMKSGNTLTLKAAGTRTWGNGDGSAYIDPTTITITTLESSASVIWEAI